MTGSRSASSAAAPDVEPRWPVLALPAPLRAYVVGLPLLVLLLGAWLAGRSPGPAGGLLLGGLLLGAAALSVEATRRLGEPAGTAVKDLLSAWWLPMAVLLPPVWVLLAPLPLMALTQWRVRRALLHRRVFSAASIGVSYAGAGAALQALPLGPGDGLLRWGLAVGVAGWLAATVNAALIAVAVRASDPQATWRELLADPEQLRLDAVEASLGVVVALLVAMDAPLVLFAVPPVLLLQRGLLHQQLRAVALLDGKTGLLNAPTWEREAESRLRALRRRALPSAVLLLDVDHFKRVNDTHGHLAGDVVLRAVAQALTTAVRDGDLLGRFGGEEFVAMLPGADEGETARVAERLRDVVSGLAVPLGDGALVRVTVSIGSATCAGSELSVPDLLAAADARMYEAKAAGRNRVVPGALLG